MVMKRKQAIPRIVDVGPTVGFRESTPLTVNFVIPFQRDIYIYILRLKNFLKIGSL